ncbi:MAG: hypothetical protein K0Q52_2326 [Microbacterium sp.]|nr:hypothetical protein [Microbacterium sp.]
MPGMLLVLIGLSVLGGIALAVGLLIIGWVFYMLWRQAQGDFE